MGAEKFRETGRGDTVFTAFNTLVDEALYESGHGGYTGTIGEKTSIVLVQLPEGTPAQTYVDWLETGRLPAGLPDAVTKKFTRYRAIYQDKWGPALAVPAEENRWIFCGWASS